MADNILTDKNGTIWYSGEYLKNQIETAYQAGLSRGIRIEIIAIQPTSNEDVNDLTQAFNSRREKEYKEAFQAGEVWKISK